MTEQAYDGTPIQSGTTRTGLTGSSPSYTMLGLREAVVVSRRYTDEKSNRSRKAVEYDCRDLRNGDIYPACRRLDHMSGPLNGDDDVLHPATNMRAGVKGSINRQTPANETDGDQVLIGFVDGSRNKPVIIGVFRHPDATYGAKVKDGERRYIIHAGTSVEVKANGIYYVTMASGAEYVVDGQNLKLGGPDATEPAIMGNLFQSKVIAELQEIGSTLNGLAATATVAIAPDVFTGVPTAATISAVQLLIDAINQLGNKLSLISLQYPQTLSGRVVLK